MIMYKIGYYTFGENISLNTSAYLGFENFCPAKIFSSMVSDIIARILTLCFSSFKINVFCHIMCVQEKDAAISDDYGKDLASVETLQRRHEGFEVHLL